MTFLNWTMLIALIGVGIPILIHLLNRRKAQAVEWGAMRFLLEGLGSRNRRMLIEEIVLMAARCLLMALVALAMARPFLPTRSTIPWALVLPTILAAAMCAGMAAAIWVRHRIRWALLSVAGFLLLVAGVVSVVEHFSQRRKWTTGSEGKDVAIVIDGSMSMTLTVGGETNFRRAIENARGVVSACNRSDAISVILGGSVPQPILAHPTSDTQQIAAALAHLAPTGGSMKVLEALNAATATLAEGNNPTKRIILITDGQNVGWDLGSAARWEFLAANFRSLPTPPRIIVRTLTSPETFRNVCISDVVFSRKVVGTDRAVRIDVKLTNTGSDPVAPSPVVLTIDDAVVSRQKVGSISPNGSETVGFTYRFHRSGPHVIRAEVLCEDDMPADNTAVRVLHVIEKVPVLIVDGAPSLRSLEGAGDFIAIALAPGARQLRPAVPTESKPSSEGTDNDEAAGNLIEPTLIAAADMKPDLDLSPYRLVILANVPRLPSAVAEKLSKYVRRGGGLLIAPGDRARAVFYNNWRGVAGEAVIPGVLRQRRLLGETPTRPAVETFTHPALAQTADLSHSDAEQVLVNSYWQLAADEKDPTVRVGGLLQTGDPLLVERKLGAGRVLMTAISLDRRDSNFPGKDSFVFTVHEMVYYLSAPMFPNPNVKPGTEIAVELGARGDLTGQIIKGQRLGVITPSGTSGTATVVGTRGCLSVTLTGAQEPGLYRVVLGAESQGDNGLARAAIQSAPFVVLRDPEESRLATLSEADFATAGRCVEISHAATIDELTAFIAGGVPGEELWRSVAITALVVIVGEIALTRWIAIRRRTDRIQPVAFGSAGMGVRAFREQVRRMPPVENQTQGGR